jgi:hypothetical protein
MLACNSLHLLNIKKVIKNSAYNNASTNKKNYNVKSLSGHLVLKRGAKQF